MVVAAAGNKVARAAIVHEDAADDAEIAEEADRAKDSGAARAATALRQLVGGKVVLAGQDGGDDGATWGRDAVAAGFEFERDSLQGGHDT